MSEDIFRSNASAFGRRYAAEISPLNVLARRREPRVEAEFYGMGEAIACIESSFAERLRPLMSPWCAKRAGEFGGDITKFRVAERRPPI